MEIKNVEQYQVAGEKPYFTMAMIALSIFGMAGIYGYLSKVFPGNLSFLLLAIGLALAVLFVQLAINQAERRANIALNEYRQLPLEVLKKCTISPELSCCTRNTFILLLNEKYPNWSIQ